MEGPEETFTSGNENKNEKGANFLATDYSPTTTRPVGELNSIDNLNPDRSFEISLTPTNSPISSPSSASMNNSIEFKNENRWRPKRASFPRLYVQMSKGKPSELEVGLESFKPLATGSSGCIPELIYDLLNQKPLRAFKPSRSYGKLSVDNTALVASPRQKFTRALAGASSFRMQNTLDVDPGKPETGPFSKLNNQRMTKQLDDQHKFPASPFTPPPSKAGFLKTFMSFDRLQCITMLCILTVTFCSYCGCSILAPFFPKKIEEKGLSELQSGFVFSAYSGVSIICSPFLGKLVPKFGAKNMILFGIVIGGLSNLAFGMIGDIKNPAVFLWLSLLSRATESIGTSFHCTGAYSYVIKLFPNCIGFAFGLTESAIGIALSMAPIFGTSLFMLGGYKTPFFVFGTIVLLCFPMNWFFLVDLDEIPDRCPEEDDESSSSDSETESVKATYDGMLKIPQILLICLIIVTMALAMSFLEPTFEPHMRKAYDASEAVVGWEFAISSIAYSMSAPCVGYATSRFKNKFIIMLIGALITLVGLLIIGPSPLIFLPSNFYISSLGMICISFGHGMAFIPTFECMLDYCTEAGFKNDMKTHGQVSGLWSCLFSVGEFIGPMLAGSIVSKFGFQTVSTIIGMVTFITIPFIVAMIWTNDDENKAFHDELD